METAAFDFALPDELIAQHPVEPRDQCRLMVVRRQSSTIEHRIFAELPSLLAPGDLLARNNSRVIPARLVGRRESTGGRWEGLFLRAIPNSTEWEILATTRGKPAEGESVLVGDGPTLRLRLERKGEGGRWLVRPETEAPGEAMSAPSLLERFGRVPLPPYIRKGRASPADCSWYQTLYALAPGSVAAPTAGLHFTEAVFAGLEARQIGCVDLTLHVGVGTFRPIEVERIEDHVLHAEWAELSPKAADALNAARLRGGRIVAVGTTSARTLETAASLAKGRNGQGPLIRPFRGETAMYLRPGRPFQGVDALVTNFHLPKSSLLVLASAFAGVELTRLAYQEAVSQRYRFYSYGDAMLIL